MNGTQSDPDVRKSAEEVNGLKANGHEALDLAETVCILPDPCHHIV